MELQVRHSSLIFFSVGFKSSFRCWSYLFHWFTCFPCWKFLPKTFLFIEIVIPILFPIGALLFAMIPSFSPSARSFLSFLNGVCFIRLQVVFVSPTLPPFFFKDSDFLIKYPFIDGKSLHSFPSMFLSGDSQEDAKGSFKFIILRSLSSPVDSIQALSIISFPCWPWELVMG